MILSIPHGHGRRDEEIEDQRERIVGQHEHGADER
jgi:hypothetical protein